MREAFDTLISTLKDLKKEGTRSLLLTPGTLQALSETVQNLKAPTTGTQDTISHRVSTRDTPVQAPSAVPAPPPMSEKAIHAQDSSPTPPASKPPAHSALKLPNPPVFDLPEGTREQRLEWLRNRVLHCEVCTQQVKPGKKVVFGVGNPQADIFFCGEAPGAEEETQGEPFVGPAGELLNRIIKAMGLSRTDVYIGNIMNWRPDTSSDAGNRPPTPEEMAFCMPYLKAQISIVQPKVIVALGATAVHGLLGYDPKRSITKSRGSWHEFEGIPTIISYHPSYVLRNGSNTVKRQIWEDMLATMERIGLPISQRQRDFFRQ
jgi:uracil-DNA glycosylase